MRPIRCSINYSTHVRQGDKTKAYLVLLFVLLIPSARAQTTASPYIQISSDTIFGGGYTFPVVNLEPGIEFDSSKITSLNSFTYDLAIEKGSVKGLGYGIGFQSLNYGRINKLIFLGGGISYVHQYTPAWNKYSLWGVGGALLDVKTSRLYLDYYYPIEDQNHNQEFITTLEIGKGRIRPVFSIGETYYSEPSYCTICIYHLYGSFSAGIKVVLRRTK